MCPALRRPGFRVAAEAKMRRALAVPTPLGDVPVGAVIFDPDGNVIGRGSNRREADGDPTAHAEIIAIREAVRNFHDGWRLTNCTIAVTLEPCCMCAGALVAARISTIIFGAYEPKMGACGSVFDVVRDPQVLYQPQVIGGVLADECAAQLGVFFQECR